MKDYRSTKKFDGYSTAFRQWRAKHSHCQFVHGYAMEFLVTFEGSLDELNWVCDFGCFKRNGIKDHMKYMFDHTTIVAKDDPELEGMVVVGEIGGDSEEILAQHIIDTGFKKPIVGYIAGRQAPKEKRMGHAGAIVMGTYGSAESKISMFAKANIPVAKRPGEVAVLLAGKMSSQ